jgi:hypothetical protein
MKNATQKPVMKVLLPNPFGNRLIFPQFFRRKMKKKTPKESLSGFLSKGIEINSADEPEFPESDRRIFSEFEPSLGISHRL